MGDKVGAKLILEDGSFFYGYSFGAIKPAAGEVVFNTGMVGYPESLTDPSYYGQILVLTYPLIGNYGVPSLEKDSMENFESDSLKIKGLIISDYSNTYSHWSSKHSLSEWLKQETIPAIYGVDTRELTKRLRERGTMLGKIIFDSSMGKSCTDPYGDVKFEDPNKRNLVAEVSIDKLKMYSRGEITIVAIDCGMKNSILQALLERNITTIRVPWNYDIINSDFKYDGILISNGPGDPKMVEATVTNVRRAMEREIPILGICLGNQILALAAGADTYKLKYGHRSQNQPCLKVGTNKCHITSQNHGYAVDAKTLPQEWSEWFVNANDGTNEGIRHKTKPFLGVQFHPEANPGPFDTEFLFDDFLNLLRSPNES
jgi:carbamoyl-phosphate synthase small subunit